jgi:hypothetical protein
LQKRLFRLFDNPARMGGKNKMLCNEDKLRKEFFMNKKVLTIAMILLIAGFVTLTQGCGTDPAFWSALSDGINSGLTGGSSGSSSSSSSGSSGSPSYSTYTVTLINKSSVTVTVYAEGYKYTIPPNSYKTHSSRNSDIDWTYEPSNLNTYFNRVNQSLTFND